MAAAVQICIDPEKASPAELVATFSHADLLDASRETSNILNGLALARALVIVQTRTRCISLQDFARHMGMGKTVVYRWARAVPCSNHMYERAIRLLAMELFDQGCS